MDDWWSKYGTAVEDTSTDWWSSAGTLVEDAPASHFSQQPSQPIDAEQAYQAASGLANPMLPGQRSAMDSILDPLAGLVRGVASTPANIKNRLSAATGEGIAQLTEFTSPETSQGFRDAARRQVEDVGLRDEHASEGESKVERLFRTVGGILGESTAIAATGGASAVPGYFATTSYAESKAQGKSESESITDGLIEGVATWAGMKIGAGMGSLAKAVGLRSASREAVKLTLAESLTKIAQGATIETAEEVATELAHYVNEVSHGKKFDRKELIGRLAEVAGPSLISGGIGEGIATAIENRRKSLPKVAQIVEDAEKFAAEHPEMVKELVIDGVDVLSRRKFATVTGKKDTSLEYRETFVDLLKANTELAEAQAAPPTDPAESVETATERKPLDDKEMRWLGKQVRGMEKRGTLPYEFGQLSDASPETAMDLLTEADVRATAENQRIFDLQQEYREVFGKGEQAAKVRRVEKKGGDADQITGFDQYVEALRSGDYPNLAAEASKLGGGDLENGLFQIAQRGRTQFKPTKAEDYLPELMEEYQRAQEAQATQTQVPTPQQPAREAEEVILPFDQQTADAAGLPLVVNINLGEMGKALGRGADSAKTWLKENFTSAGLRNEDIQRLNTRRLGNIAKQTKAMKQLKTDLDRAVYGQYGRVKSLPPELRAKMDAALKGEETDLPAPILAALAPMRAQIDALSEQFVKAGIGGEDFQGSVDENMGVYVTRTYRKFAEKDWAQIVKDDPKIMQEAKSALRSEFPDDTDSDIQWRINMLLDKDSVDAKAMPQKFHRDAKFHSILMQRKDLPKWLRDLYGEYRDPWINHTTTVTKMAQLLAHNEFMQDVRRIGIDNGFFSVVDPREAQFAEAGEQRRVPSEKNPAHYRQVNATGNRLLEPLADLYTDPETASALEDLFSVQSMSKGYRYAVGLSMLTKWNMTVGNSKGYLRNFLGNPAFAMSNGDLLSGDFTKAYKTTAANLLTKNDPAMRQYIQRLAELQVIDSNIDTAEFKAMLGDLRDSGEMPNLTGGTIRRGIGRGVGFLNELYQSMDIFWKVNGFEAKKKYYAQLHPDLSQDAIEQLAANDVRAHYPTYSEVPKGVKAVNRFPGLGNFLSFRTEVIRTTKNVIRDGLREVKSENPIERAMGKKRLLGLAASLATLPTLGAISKMIFGISDDEDDDVRLFQPPWTRNSAYLYLSPTDNGAVSSIDLSFMDPRAQFTKPIYALLGPGTTEEQITEAFREGFDPLREDILFGRVAAAFFNKTVDGRQVYNESAGTAEKLRKSRDYIGEVLLPGTVGQMGRIRKALDGEVSPSGREYDPVLELAGAIGVRATPVDVRTGLMYRSNDFRRAVRDAEAGIRSALLQGGTVPKEETERVIKDFMAQRGKYVAQWHELTQAAIRLGVPANEAKQTVYGAAGSQALTEHVMGGTYTPYQPSEETLQDVIAKPKGGERLGIFRRLNPAPTP